MVSCAFLGHPFRMYRIVFKSVLEFQSTSTHHFFYQLHSQDTLGKMSGNKGSSSVGETDHTSPSNRYDYGSGTGKKKKPVGSSHLKNKMNKRNNSKHNNAILSNKRKGWRRHRKRWLEKGGVGSLEHCSRRRYARLRTLFVPNTLY